MAAFVTPGLGSAAADPVPNPSAAPCATSPTPSGDAPTAPGTPEVVHVFLNAATLRWTPATDADGIACYEVVEEVNGALTVRASFSSASTTEGKVTLPFPPYGVVSETHTLRMRAIDTTGVRGPLSGPVTVTIYNDLIPTTSPSASPTGACRVSYTSTSWPNGMSTSIALTNTGSQVIPAWRLSFVFPSDGQQVTYGWSARWSQNGTGVDAQGYDWNKDLAPGQTLWIGFTGANTGANPKPASFSVNGARCA
ncbi:cellulose binding domain-containing protein [Microbispora sp. H11081]|uniref:cellulose binding domain-containing protein n=1 Tax=Microbispora sp. H11081 TaxID=2729107 RepID=UPI001473DD92|nr:cellulose binding domain-containing protein [Microbispora sp. H11081]